MGDSLLRQGKMTTKKSSNEVGWQKSDQNQRLLHEQDSPFTLFKCAQRDREILFSLYTFFVLFQKRSWEFTCTVQ